MDLIALKVSGFGVILDRVFPYSAWIRRDTFYAVFKIKILFGSSDY